MEIHADRKKGNMSFQRRLLAGEFVVLSEMSTPKGVDISEMMVNARRLKGRVDAIIIPDMDNGVMRMSGLAGGVLMNRLGIDTVMHIYTRDKNRIALQGDILAAHVLGIQNLLVVDSEDMDNGDHRDAMVVNDLDEIGLLQAIKSLKKGVDLAGFELKGTPEYTVGCTVSPIVDDKTLEKEIRIIEKKVAAGAQYIVLPPIFDMDKYLKIIDKLEQFQRPLVATVFLLKSVGMARYISVNDPSCQMTEDIIKRIRYANDRDHECIRIASEHITYLKEVTKGVRIITLGWEHKVPELLDNAGL